MNTIELSFTGLQKVYHDFYKPLVLVSNIELPPMYNMGWNSFDFIGGSPDFIAVTEIPLFKKRETENFIYNEAQIEVLSPSGKKTTGNIYSNINKQTGEIKIKFDFN